MTEDQPAVTRLVLLNPLTVKAASMSDHDSIVGIEFRQVSIATGYQITNVGTLWSDRSGRLKQLNPSTSPKGYFRVTFPSADGRKRTAFIHSLVLTAFVGPRPTGMVCCHWNGDKKDNRVENLRWDTVKANAEDGKRLDEHACVEGVNNPRAILSESDVSEIKKRISDGMPSVEIAEKFGATVLMISKIKCGRSWGNVPWPEGFKAQPAQHAKLTYSDAVEIRSLSAGGMNGRALARKFNVCAQTICNVLSGKLHRKEAG